VILSLMICYIKENMNGGNIYLTTMADNPPRG